MVTKATETRTLLIERQGLGRIKLTIPANAKVTFGAFAPGSKGSYGDLSATLRIYVGTQNNQIAVIRNVISFRDLSLAYEEEKVRKNGESTWHKSEHGSDYSESEIIDKEWVSA